jgi:hypothetical protein
MLMKVTSVKNWLFTYVPEHWRKRYLFITGETTVHVHCALESEADCIGAADFFKKVDQLSFQSTSIREYGSNGSTGPK